jgi:2-phosphoglycerate kinase
MLPENNQVCPWKVLLIGGSSGVGKTVVARELSRRLSVSLLLLDDVRLAIQQVTGHETEPDLHVFLDYQDEQWRNAESICADWVRVGNAMLKPLQAIIHHHLIVPDVGPLIIEGDGILPVITGQYIEPKAVSTVFIVEQDEEQLLRNLRSRGRGFNDWHEPQQKGLAHASWLYGQWLAREAKQLDLPVIDAQPQQTLLERLLASTGAN